MSAKDLPYDPAARRDTPLARKLKARVADAGPISLIRDGDMVRVDADSGTLEVLADLTGRDPAPADLTGNGTGVGRELFEVFRRNVGRADRGAGSCV